MKLVIDRARWGKGCLLQRQNQKMCCLGFYMKECGFQDSEIVSTGMPAALYASAASHAYAVPRQRVPEWLMAPGLGGGVTDSVDASHLASINDSSGFNDDEAKRESLITTIFAKHDVQVEFTGVRDDRS